MRCTDRLIRDRGREMMSQITHISDSKPCLAVPIGPEQS